MTNKNSIEEIEYKIKYNELLKLEKENKKGSLQSSTFVTLLIAIISLLGSFIANYIQKNNQIELEKQKFESDLIIMAVKTNDIRSSRDNLKFLLEVGLIQKYSLQLSKVLGDTSVPILKLNSYSNINPIYSLEGSIILPKEKEFKNLFVSIWPHSIGHNTTHLKQNIPVNIEGKFKAVNLEEINYIVEINYRDTLLKRFMYSPNKKLPNDFCVYDFSKAFK
jgi:hypothetical protein